MAPAAVTEDLTHAVSSGKRPLTSEALSIGGTIGSGVDLGQAEAHCMHRPTYQSSEIVTLITPRALGCSLTIAPAIVSVAHAFEDPSRRMWPAWGVESLVVTRR